MAYTQMKDIRGYKIRLIPENIDGLITSATSKAKEVGLEPNRDIQVLIQLRDGTLNFREWGASDIEDVYKRAKDLYGFKE